MKLTIPDFNAVTEMITEYARLKAEYGAPGVQALLDKARASLDECLSGIQALENDAALSDKEPDEYGRILALRPVGKRKLWSSLDESVYADRLQGAMLGRFAGCTLGTIVEGWDTARMEGWAKRIGDSFPPVDYWSQARIPFGLRYESECFRYTRDQIDGVPVDDDIAYTLLDLLIAEEYGLDFTTGDVGKAWLKYLPFACTAEEVALANLKAGVAADRAADINNPYVQWIGADIRSDGWAYIAAGYPEKAARMAYYDAYISHRRNGIYGEMFFSAAQAAAFAVDNAGDALKIGLAEIPKDCTLANELRWALDESKNIRNHKDAVAAVSERFSPMSPVHTNNNACLTVFGLMIGGNDVTKVISEVVAMGYDNDCTAATAGSIIGAVMGKEGVPAHWHKNFNNTVHSYLNGQEKFYIDDLTKRFTALARKVWA